MKIMKVIVFLAFIPLPTMASDLLPTHSLPHLPPQNVPIGLWQNTTPEGHCPKDGHDIKCDLPIGNLSGVTLQSETNEGYEKTCSPSNGATLTFTAFTGSVGDEPWGYVVKYKNSTKFFDKVNYFTRTVTGAVGEDRTAVCSDGEYRLDMGHAIQFWQNTLEVDFGNETVIVSPAYGKKKAAVDSWPEYQVDAIYEGPELIKVTVHPWNISPDAGRIIREYDKTNALRLLSQGAE